MAKKHYLDRMMTARDPRFHKIAMLLGAEAPPTIEDLRGEYVTKFGKKPFMGWDAKELARRLKGGK